MTTRTWFITGTSRGFGREWAIAALDRGENVVATARSLRSVDDLAARFGRRALPMELDVTDRQAVFAAVERAHDHFGGIDIVINNAGYGLFGMIEEVTEDQARAQIETNLFGALWVTQATLPLLRDQHSGHIIQVSSIGGISAFPGIGWYNASKWALEGFSQALASEVASFGIKVTLVEPTGNDTDWAGSSAIHAKALPAYQRVHAQAAEARARRISRPGDPKATRAAILAVVDAEEPPLRIFFGDGPLAVAQSDYGSRLDTWEQWEPVSIAAQGATS